MLRDLPVCHSVDPNCGQRDVPVLLPVNRSQNHLRDDSIALRDLLLYFDLDVVEITEPLREAFVVQPNGGETSLFRSGVSMIDAVDRPEIRKLTNVTASPDPLDQLLDDPLIRFTYIHGSGSYFLIDHHASNAALDDPLIRFTYIHGSGSYFLIDHHASNAAEDRTQ